MKKFLLILLSLSFCVVANAQHTLPRVNTATAPAVSTGANLPFAYYPLVESKTRDTLNVYPSFYDQVIKFKGDTLKDTVVINLKPSGLEYLNDQLWISVKSRSDTTTYMYFMSNVVGNFTNPIAITYSNPQQWYWLFFKFNGVKWNLVSSTLDSAKIGNVTGTAPVTVSTAGSNRTVSMAAANGSTDGYLSSTTYTAFNNKYSIGTYQDSTSIRAIGFSAVASSNIFCLVVLTQNSSLSRTFSVIVDGVTIASIQPPLVSLVATDVPVSFFVPSGKTYSITASGANATIKSFFIMR